MKNITDKTGLMCRSSTLRSEYIKRILEKNSMSKKEMEERYKKYNIDINTCVYCGDDAHTLDHIYGVVNNLHFSGYTNDISNLIPACSSCNSSKGKKDWDEWLNNCNTEYVKKIRNKKGFKDRCKIIDNYIEREQTKNKKIDDISLKKINKNADSFNELLNEKLSELNRLFIEHKIFFEKEKEKNK